MNIAKVGDASLSFEIAGAGPPILLIQGAGVAGSGWAFQTRDLTSDFTCLTFDNRGFGDSTGDATQLSINQMAQDTLGLMDHVGWASAHVVGHSMGGLIAQEMAHLARHRVRSLALLCTFSKGPEATRLTASIVWKGIWTRVGTRNMRRAFLEMLYPKSYLGSVDQNALAAELAPILGRDLADSPSIMMKQLGAMRAYDRSADLGKLSGIPTLVASAQDDPIALPEFGRTLANSISGARYTEYQRASHAVILQTPDELNSTLRLHFDRVESIAAQAARMMP